MESKTKYLIATSLVVVFMSLSFTLFKTVFRGDFEIVNYASDESLKDNIETK